MLKMLTAADTLGRFNGLQHQEKHQMPAPTTSGKSLHIANSFSARTVFLLVAQWLRQRSDTRLLQCMSEQQLKDIGLRRHDIERVVRHGRSPDGNR